MIGAGPIWSRVIKRGEEAGQGSTAGEAVLGAAEVCGEVEEDEEARSLVKRGKAMWSSEELEGEEKGKNENLNLNRYAEEKKNRRIRNLKGGVL